MRVPVRRRFGLLDVMILVAAMAVWLAASRHLASKMNRAGARGPPPRPDPHRARAYRPAVVLPLVGLPLDPAPAAAALSATTLVSAWFRGLRRGGPGGGDPSNGLGHPIHTRLAGWDLFDGFWRASLPFLRSAVAGAWLALIVAGCWRAERSGIDRLGRVLGACWLVGMLITDNPFHKIGLILTNLLTGMRS